MNSHKKPLGIILVIFFLASAGVSARGFDGYNNGVDHNFNDENNNDYHNNFYYGAHSDYNNGVVVLPDDSDDDPSCQSTQVCDSSGSCVIQQNCD